MGKMRILSWNVEKLTAGGVAVAEEIVRHEADLVALQEFQPGKRGDEFIYRVQQDGFGGIHFEQFEKGFCSAIFSRQLLNPVTKPAGLPPQHWATYWAEASCGDFGISCIHVPVSSYPEERRAFREAAVKRCRERGQFTHVLVGDFNATPEEIVEPNRKLPADRWFDNLRNMGWRDAWRTCNSGKTEYSCFTRAGSGFRLDQAWLSPSAANLLLDAKLDHAARLRGLSDHSLLIVDLK